MHLSGDIGGIGISRFHVQRIDDTTTTVADLNTAGAAIRTFYQGPNFYPSNIAINVQALVQIFDSSSGIIYDEVTMTAVPPTLPGGLGGNYGAGLGARINWRTRTVVGRRFIRGATYLLPYAQGAFNATGAVSSGSKNSIIAAGNKLIADLAAAQLYLVVWRRPTKANAMTAGTGVVIGCDVPDSPAGLRSRRS